MSYAQCGGCLLPLDDAYEHNCEDAIAAARIFEHDAENLAVIRSRRAGVERDATTKQLMADMHAALAKFNDRDYKVERARLFTQGVEDPFCIPANQISERVASVVHALINGYRMIRIDEDTTDVVAVATRKETP